MAARLGVRVDTDFDQATKDLSEFKAESISTEKAIKKFQESFKGEQVDKFIDKQKLSRTALRATRGEVDAAQAEYKSLRSEIEKLIKKGISPQDESLKKLTKRYDEVGKEVNQYTNAQKKAVVQTKKTIKVATLAKRAWAAVGVSAGIAIAAIVKNTFAVAKAGDEFAKASRRIGLTAEELQELTFVAERQGVSGEELTKSLGKLNKNVGDLKANYGSLNTLLKNTNPELLENLKNAKSNNEAWELSVKALEGTSNELDRASLAQALFGRSGLKLLTITEEGTEGIKALRNEAREYGVISNDNAKISEQFVDAQTNLTAVFKNLTNQLGLKLFPVFRSIFETTTNLLKEDKDLNQVTSQLIDSNREYANVTKVLADESADLTRKERAKLEIRKAELKIKVVDSIKLANKLYKDQTKALPLLKAEIKSMTNAYVGSSARLKDYQKIIDEITSRERISRTAKQELAHQQRNVSRTIKGNQLRLERLSKLELEAAKRTSAYTEAVQSLATGLKNNVISVGDLVGLNKDLIAEAVALSEIVNSETGAFDKNTESFTRNFETKQEALTALKDLEGLAYEERLIALAEFNQSVKDSTELSGQAKADLLKKSNSEIAKVEKDFTKARQENAKDLIGIYLQVAGQISNIISNLSKNERAAAIAGKLISIATAVINTAVAVTAAGRTGNISKAIAMGVLGAAQVATIATTPIPSAQTGTSPDGLDGGRAARTGQDNSFVRVNEDENIKVTPRGESSDSIRRTTININEQIIFDVVQRGVDNGYINISDDNIQVVPV